MKSKCEASKRSTTTLVASVIAAIFALIPSCSSGSPGGDPPKSTSVYVAGDCRGQACYWKGTERTDLPSPGSGWSISYGIDVSGGVVYTAGFYNDGIINACYWEGTTRRDLPGDGANSSFAYSIKASGGIAYVAGYYSDGETNIPCYWKDGIRADLPLPEGSLFGEARGIAVVDGAVYLCGEYENEDGSLIPCYWTDTPQAEATLTDLEPSVPAASMLYANGISVSGGMVYVAGTYYSGDPMRSYSCYWEDGALIDLPGGEVGSSEAYGIVASGSAVYTVGYYSPSEDATRACYWSGTERFDLPDEGSSSSYATSTATSGGKVYVAGYYNGGGIDIACYWKDGIKTDLPGGTGYAYGNAIAVIEE
jgi:hypothetical protein